MLFVMSQRVHDFCDEFWISGSAMISVIVGSAEGAQSAFVTVGSEVARSSDMTSISGRYLALFMKSDGRSIYENDEGDEYSVRVESPFLPKKIQCM